MYTQTGAFQRARGQYVRCGRDGFLPGLSTLVLSPAAQLSVARAACLPSLRKAALPDTALAIPPFLASFISSILNFMSMVWRKLDPYDL
jgi:hypothetical protein